MHLLMSHLRDEEGQTIIEYALVLGTVSIVLASVFVVTGLTDDFQTLVENLFAD